jgi:Fe-S-cluster containining protein
VEKNDFQKGIELLGQPALPLVSMVQFLYLTGPFVTVAEVIDEMPEPIETGYTRYEHPRQLLRRHLDHLHALETLKNGEPSALQVVDESGNPVDEMTAVTSLVSQRVMEEELETINSVLCGPCGCTLCCTGPDPEMQQEFFEIPLQDEEQDIFSVPCHDTAESRRCHPMDEDTVLQVEGRPFYRQTGPELFHWRKGWSLILPRESSCPGLDVNGRCRVYEQRPLVCRRPQIFSYILEPLEQPDQYRLRSSLLAVTDCPYVEVLQQEIAAYGAACELDPVFKGNKQ